MINPESVHLQRQKSGYADDAVMADQRGVTTQVYGKITNNTQIRECV